jgi:hypothetical protein
MAGLRRLSTISEVYSPIVFSHMFPYLLRPRLPPSLAPSTRFKENHRLSSAAAFTSQQSGSNLRSCHLGLGGAGLGRTNISGMAPAHVGQAALKVDGMWRGVRTTSEFCLDAAGKRWRMWTHEVVELYLEKLGWSGSSVWEGCVWECLG